MKTHCPVCESSDSSGYASLYDDRYGYRGVFDILKCERCGHKYLKNEFSARELSRMYSDFYPRSSFSLDGYRPFKEMGAFKTWLANARYAAYRWVPGGVKVLDIGCGFGEALGYHKNRGCEVYGVEADENIRRVAERFGYRVHVGLFDPDLYEKGFFDYVTMDQVIEHTADPVGVLKGVEKVLKPGGCAVLATPNSNGWGEKVFGKRWVNWHIPYHLQHFSAASMGIAAKKAGLAVERYRTTTDPEWLYCQWIHLSTRPPEGKKSSFWTLSGGYTAGQKAWRVLFFLMNRLKINYLLTRLFDSLGMGDNFVFLLRKPPEGK